MTHYRHWEDPVFVEAPEATKWQDGTVSNSNHVAKILTQVDERDIAQVFSIALIQLPSREVDPDEIVEYQRVGRLRKLLATIGKCVLRGIEQLSKLVPSQKVNIPTLAFHLARPIRTRICLPDLRGMP